MLCKLVVDLNTIARLIQLQRLLVIPAVSAVEPRYHKYPSTISLIKRSYHHWFLDVVYGAILAYIWCLVIMCHIPRLSIKTTASTANLASSLPHYLFKVVYYLRNKYIVFFTFSIHTSIENLFSQAILETPINFANTSIPLTHLTSYHIAPYTVSFH